MAADRDTGNPPLTEHALPSSAGPATAPIQHALPGLQETPTLWPCDICKGTGRETDPETRIILRCRVCAGTGSLDYDPAGCAANPFAGLEAA